MGGGTAGELQPQVGDTAGAGLKYLLISTHQTRCAITASHFMGT